MIELMGQETIQYKMLCCGTSRSQAIQKELHMAYLKKSTRFSATELNELRRRFQRMSQGSQYLTKEQFRDNLGLMGLDTVYFLSDRIFSILDNNRDDRIKFDEFVFYFDKITHGTQTEKAEISFNLIDQERVGYFTIQDFQTTMHGLVQSWVIMTGQTLWEMQVRLDSRIKEIFNQLDQDKDQRVSLQEYQEAVLQDSTLLNIFDFLKKDFSSQIQEAQLKKEALIIDEFTQIRENINSVYEFMLGQQQVDRGIQLPRSNRNSMLPRRYATKTGTGTSEQKRKAEISGIPYLLGDDEESCHQRLSYPLHKTSTMNQSINIRMFKSLGSEDKFNMSKNKSFNQLNIKPSPRIGQMIQRHPQNDSYGGLEGLDGDIKLNFRIMKTDNSDEQGDEIEEEKEHNKALVQPPVTIVNQGVRFKPELQNSIEFNQNFQIQPQISQRQYGYFIEEEVEKMFDAQIAQMNEAQIRQKYKEALIQIKRAMDNMNFAIQKLEVNQENREKDYLLEQDKKQQLVHLRIKTVANIHKSQHSVQLSHKSPKKESKKHLTVQFGHENWNLVLNMMIGIQMSVRTEIQGDDLNLLPKHFCLKNFFELVPKRTGADKKENFKICKFLDFAPAVFASIRRLLGIDDDDYLAAIGPEQMLQSLLKGDLSTLQELTSSGKSGSFFYYSADGRFTLKTIHKDEYLFLRSILKPYYDHLKSNSDSLIIKFYGLHKIYVKQATGSTEYKIYFIVMSNVFHTPYEIHVRYDLKGSLYKRSTAPELDYSVARKDLDFLQSGIQLQVDERKKKQFIEQLQRDVKFFSDNNIIDYSLLLGIHNVRKHNLKSEQSIISEGFQDYFLPDSLHVMKSLDDTQIYYFGIIDILTSFNTKKTLEYLTKRIIYGPTISAIPPQDYANRFLNFMSGIFSKHQMIQNDSKVIEIMPQRISQPQQSINQ